MVRTYQAAPTLTCGDFVRIQNQIGHHPKKWDKTGTVIEVRQFNQYVVRVDGSGRVTLRNRKFLRKYAPVVPRQPHHTINNDLNYMKQPTKIVSPSARTIDDIPDSHTADMIPHTPIPHTPIVHKQTRPSDLTLSQTSPSAPSIQISTTTSTSEETAAYRVNIATHPITTTVATTRSLSAIGTCDAITNGATTT